jgi:hypothetical protein
VSHRIGKPNGRVVWTGPQSAAGHACQVTIVILSLLILVFAPLAFGAVRLWSLGPVFIAIEVASVLWIVRILAAHEIPVVFSMVGPPAVAMAAYGVIRYGLSEVEPVASLPMMLWLATALLFFLILNNVRHRWHITAVVWVLIGTGTLIALYTVWQAITGSSFVWAFPQYDRYLGSASGTFIRPNHSAAYLEMVFPIAAATCLFSRRRFEQKVAAAIASLVMGAALLLIAAPNGWLGWLAGMIVLLVYIMKRGGKKSRWLMVGLGLLGLLLVVALIGLLTSGGSESGFATTERRGAGALWHAAWQLARGHWLLGVGPGMFRWLYPVQRTVQGVVDTPESEYWSVFAEYGLIGLVLALWVFVAFVIAAIQILSVRASRYSASTPSNRYAFAVGGLAAATAIAIGCISDSSLRAPANVLTLAAIMATTLTCGVHPSGKIEEDEALPGRYAPLAVKGVNKAALAVSLAIVVVLLASRLRKSYPSDFYLRLARQAEDSLDWDTARERYVQAWKYDRRNFEVTTAIGDYLSARATWNIGQREKLLTEALAWYERAFTANPYAMDVQIHIGRVYDALGKRELAEEHYRRAIQADPQNASYHAQLGLHDQRWGKTGEAVANFARAYELGGDDPLPEVELRQLGKLEP